MLDLDPFEALALSLTHSPGVFALLVGSGLSRATGIPTGWEITLDLIRRIGVLKGVTDQRDWVKWFSDTFGSEPSYSEILDALAKTPSERRAILHEYIEPKPGEDTKKPTKAHRDIAKLVADGTIKVIVTTNFDRLIETALREAGVEPTVISNEDAVVGAIPLVHSRCTVIKLHGDYLDSRIKNTDKELSAYAPAIDGLLDEVLDRFGLVVVGWSGEWDTALRNAILRNKSRRYPMYWVTRSAVKPLAQGLITHSDARVITATDADNFFGKLITTVTALRNSQKRHPQSVGMALALAKRLCRDDGLGLEWAEFLADEVAKVRKLVGVLGDEQPTPDTLNARIDTMVAVSEVLRRAAMICARWGTPDANRAVIRAIRSLGFRAQSQGGWEMWVDLQDFCATQVFYWALGGALAGDNFARAYQFMHSTIRILNREENFVYALPPASLGKVHWKWLTGLETRKTPASDFLSNLFAAEVKDIAFEPSETEALFDVLEALCALEFSHIRIQLMPSTGLWFWAPIGRFAWRRSGAEATDLLNNFEHLAPESPILLAGLLGGTPEGAKLAAQKLREFLPQMVY